jgi:hypothetical protein
LHQDDEELISKPTRFEVVSDYRIPRDEDEDLGEIGHSRLANSADLAENFLSCEKMRTIRNSI